MKRKICVVTGTRAEYGLLNPLMCKIKADRDLELQIIATNMHLSPEFGLTFTQIEQDGFTINKKIENLLSSDSQAGITKSMGLALIGLADAYQDLRPDLVVILGDRYEAFAAAGAATLFTIPVAHLHGGELTEGAIDDAFRHSITKMSHLHFTSTERYRMRVIQLGESPERVFHVGAMAIDAMKQYALLSREAFERAIDFQLGPRNLLVTYHSVTREKQASERQFEQLLQALDPLEETHLIFTKPNADAGGRGIIRLIDEYVEKNRHKAVSCVSMGQVTYFSALRYVDAVVGNSSSGIIEAPSFRIGTINIGARQQGRIAADSVIHCEPVAAAISQAIKRLYSQAFQESLPSVVNPYDKGGASAQILSILKQYPLDQLLKKNFYDVQFVR